MGSTRARKRRDARDATPRRRPAGGPATTAGGTCPYCGGYIAKGMWITPWGGDWLHRACAVAALNKAQIERGRGGWMPP